MNEILANKLQHLPRKPGIYQHKDAEGKVLYVGKAKNLRNRVRSYFHQSKPKQGRLGILVSKIEDVEVIVTDTEAEALILENNLIKRLKPRYNVTLRDDKTYPFICIKNERFPRVFPTRRIRKDGSLYFGPYIDAKAMRLMLKTIRDIFKLRTCSLNLNQAAIDAGKYDTCLDYHIQRCAGPCVGYESEEHYNQTIEQIKKLLNGKTEALISLLKDEMTTLASAKKFEEAADYRDRIQALEKFSKRQKVVTDVESDRDLFALEVDRDAGVAVGVLFKVREGKIIGRQHKYLRGLDEVADDELMQRFVVDYYTDATFFPDEVYMGSPVADPKPVQDILRKARGRKVELKVPERGEKAELIRMVQSNAKLLVSEWKLQKAKQEKDRLPHAVQSLQRDLRLKKPPKRIECFDISHLGGTGTVASCVVFVDGKPRKSEYRTFNIRTVESGKPDDFKSMREVIQRRYTRTLEENGPWPDLVLVDGGKGQLSSAVESLRSLDLFGRFPLVGLAKRLEEVFEPGKPESTFIPRTSSALRLLQRIRDEAHRFAVTAQRKQRKKSTLHSELMNIPGVGAKTVQKLLSSFGSVRGVRNASAEALTAVVGPSISQKLTIYFETSTNQNEASTSQNETTSL
ncbi:MAG: excinuclease ABC subunit UvrC [Rubricoccaceae bacterium]|nr:excinuclease ABC subunit UvrC [Rubricoccaceae bacterium]